MGFLDRLFGTNKGDDEVRGQPGRALSADEQALQRYRYMVQNAPPETIEQAHAEAFARLTPEQRQTVLGELIQAAPAGERSAVEKTSSEDPQGMARLATRTEIRQPGFMERTLGGGMGFGGSLLTSFAAGFVGSMVANSFFDAMGGFGGEHATAEESTNHAGDDAPAEDSDGLDDGGGFDDGGDGFDMDI